VSRRRQRRHRGRWLGRRGLGVVAPPLLLLLLRASWRCRRLWLRQWLPSSCILLEQQMTVHLTVHPL
jgi:hypothetical protein